MQEKTARTVDAKQPIPGANCRFCSKPLRHSFADLGVSPLCQTHIAPEQLNQMEPFYPLHALVCDSCWLVQLQEYVAPDDIFGEYAYFSSYVDALVNQAHDYCDSVSQRFKLGERSFVAEIASNDGYLLQHFVKKSIPCLGIEPAANVAAAAVRKGVPTTVQFFGVETAKRIAASFGKPNLLIGNNVLAHVPDLNDFVSGMKVLLAEGGVITMEFPHLMTLMDQCQFDTIYHEHFSYYSLSTAVRVFKAHGLTIFDVEEIPTHGGSLRIYATHASELHHAATARMTILLSKEQKAGFDDLAIYQAFAKTVVQTKRNILEFLIAARKAGKKVVGYGAPGKGNTLLNYCGIRTDFIEFTVDRNPYKQGKYTPGTRIPILAPEAIMEAKPDFLFILPWNLKDEIVSQTSYIRKWGGRWVVPIPSVAVIV